MNQIILRQRSRKRMPYVYQMLPASQKPEDNYLAGYSMGDTNMYIVFIFSLPLIAYGLLNQSELFLQFLKFSLSFFSAQPLTLSVFSFFCATICASVFYQ